LPGTYDPSYSGGRDQEDHGSKPARANSCETLSRKYLSQKMALVAQGAGPKFKPQYCKKKKKKNLNEDTIEPFCQPCFVMGFFEIGS
jgi:hypothetical protein